MKVWKNTTTLDALVPELLNTVDASEAEVAVIGSKPINLAKMPQLKIIFKCGVGIDNIPFTEAKNRNIQVILPSNETKEYIYEETANFAVYLIMKMLYRGLGSLEKWEKTNRSFLGQKNVLVLGQGNIGLKVSSKLSSLLTVNTYDPVNNSEDLLEGSVRQADVITLHMPLNEKTISFFDAEKLSWMKNGAILINTARGAIVHEQSLYNEVKVGRIFAAFDVFWEEPYHGILRQFHPEIFFMTPHVASNCADFLNGLARDFNEIIK